MNASGLGFAHLLSQTDAVGATILLLLLAMSLATWYLIAAKAITAAMVRRRSSAFLAAFHASPTLQTVSAGIGDAAIDDEPFSRLAREATAAARHHQRHTSSQRTLAPSTCPALGPGQNDSGAAEFVTRAMRRAIDEETARLESGLTVLASIGSTAPFLGLFGTVWGVYHALAAIGMSGQGTLDQVAGPVGEALIMTALGLAVAIPAVLAYNFTVRRNRLVLGRLDSFAHDLFALVTTGAHVREPHENAPEARPHVAVAQGVA